MKFLLSIWGDEGSLIPFYETKEKASYIYNCIMCLLMEASAPFSRPHYGQLRSFTVNYGRRLRSITVNYGHLGSITLADYGQLRSFTVNYGRRLRSITVIYGRQLRSPITVGDSCTPQISKPKVMVLEPKILVLNRF